MQQNSVRATTISVGGGLVCLIPFESGKGQERAHRLMRRIAEELRRTVAEEPIVVLGNPCHALSDYRGAWERCWRVIRIARAFGRSGALTGEDFGPLPMLVAAADVEEVRGFVNDAIGAMVAHDQANGTPYLETLSAYVREGCRSQACADAMGLHVTTLRYRLSRIKELFNIEVDTSERRFAVELAIRLYGVIDNRKAAES
jgi:purine catabolism regulator